MLSTLTASQRERAIIAAFRYVPADLRKGVREAARDAITPLMVREASRLSTDKLLSRVIGTGRYSEYRGTPGVKFGGSKRITSSGATAKQLARPLEFGSDGRRYRDYLQRRKGTQVSVLRRTTRQFMPDTGYRGRAINRAAEAINDDVVEVWADLAEAALLAAFDGKRL